MVSVAFANPQVSDKMERDILSEFTQPSENFFEKLFSVQAHSPEVTSWLPVILQSTQTRVRSGLKEDLREESLRTRYDPEERLSFLPPPKVNKEIPPNLNVTIVTGDRHQSQAHSQVGASPNVLAAGISELSKLVFLLASPEEKTTISRIAYSMR